MLVLDDPLRNFAEIPRGCVATIGNFDGMHRGHQELIRGVVSRAAELGLPAVALTFNPHPLTIVAPDRAPRQIITLQQKEELLAELGLDAMVVVPFTHELSRWPAEQFVDDLLVRRLAVRELHVGQDFCYGAGRTGNLETLRAAGERHNFTVRGVPDIRVRGIRISSSLVRRAIDAGDIRILSLALGRDYWLDGRVVTGRRLGRKIGFPTVNVAPFNDLFPGSGVYATTCRFESFQRSFESVTNIGIRPTLYENYAVTIESYILDFDATVYGDQVRLSFHRLLRREQQFRSALELTNQIRADVERTRRFFWSRKAR